MTATALTLPGARGGARHVPASAPFAGTDRLPEGTSPADVSRYGDATWDLSPLSRRQHEPARQVNWDLFPVPLRASFKRAGWALVNLPTPDTLLERAATCRARQPGTATIASTAEHWRRYAAWLASRGISRLADVDSVCHGEWAAHVARLPVAGRNPRAGAERGQRAVGDGARTCRPPTASPCRRGRPRGCATTFPGRGPQRERHRPGPPGGDVPAADLGAAVHRGLRRRGPARSATTRRRP
jgi:hypothetical protein